jgi:galactonate dehydratase
MEDLFPVQVPYENGYMLAPDRPGLGIEFNEDAIEAHPFKWGHGPRLHREDGSFTNW